MPRMLEHRWRRPRQQRAEVPPQDVRRSRRPRNSWLPHASQPCRRSAPDAQPTAAAKWILENLAAVTSASDKYPGKTEDEPAEPEASASPEGLAVRSFSLTDTGNAERFVAHHGEDIRYCHEWGKWLLWDGARWATDRRGEIDLRASQTVAAILSEALGAKGKRARGLRAHATASESASSLSAMVKIARSRPGIAVVPDDFDRDPLLFNCRNGTLDLRASALLPHARGALITKVAPVDYNPTTECPRWQSFIGDVMGGNDELVAFLQRAVGYSLTGVVKEQVLFFLHGAGANGKSTFLRTLLELFGDYGLQAAPNLLIARNADAHPTAIADLFGRRLAVCQEIEGGRSFAEATVKQLTGEDVIRARRMREDFWSFAPTHKLWLAANHKPNIHGTDHAIWRRIRLIPFTVTIPEEKRDPDLLEKLRAERAGDPALGCQRVSRLDAGRAAGAEGRGQRHGRVPRGAGFSSTSSSTSGARLIPPGQ